MRASGRPSAVDPNFHEQLLIPFELPENLAFCPTLEVQVKDKDYGVVSQARPPRLRHSGFPPPAAWSPVAACHP